MTTRDDILSRIAAGRLAVERTVAFSLSCTLAEVEAMVRELMEADPPDIAAERAGVAEVRRVLAADLTDLQTMRAMLDQKGYTPDPNGLRALVQVWGRIREERDALIDERDALADGARDLRAELDRLANNLHDSIRERDTLADEVTVLRAQVAALTPGLWVRIGDQPPIEGEIVVMRTTEGGVPWIQPVFSTTLQGESANHLWRPIPAAFLALPATTEANAQPEGGR